MSVSEQHSGIADTHILALERLASSEDTFIFVRPTEYDTTLLIKAGYATKSMDVHHKSSNWGPMAGFVPIDPAFNKKTEGAPNPKMPMPKKHGVANPVQLSFKEKFMLGLPKVEFKSEFTLAPRPEGSDPKSFPFVARRSSGATGMRAQRQRFEQFQTVGGNLPEFRFMTANPAEMGNKSTLFVCVKRNDDWFLFYVVWAGEVGWLHPLNVFAYPQGGKLIPVTGDYDLWMVAPHFDHFDAHAVTSLQKDKHGGSAASAYTMQLIPKMNNACLRGDNPVFNHGAESQNYGFTQALDWNLAMFTPGGTSRMVRMNQMPMILADLQQAGYLVMWNKRYGENDPQLMHKKDERGNLTELRKEITDLFSQLEEIKRTASPRAVASEFQSTKAMPGAMKSELGLMAKRFQATRELGLEQSRIYRFHRQLLEFLAGEVGILKVLSSADFGSDFKMYSSDVRNLHAKLQQLLVKAQMGDGQSDSALSQWLTQHTPDINRIKAYWA